MARTAAAGFWSLGRAAARTLQRGAGAPSLLKAGLILIALMFSGVSQAEPVKGEASFSAGGGYARLVFKLAEDVDAEVIAAGSIVVVRFKRPVDIPGDQLSDAGPDYVGSVRRDPDGSAIRLSLTRRVTINTMTAGERVFVDLLPDTWSGHPPGLPPEVIRELSERARAAERALRQPRATVEAQKRMPVRVRASVQPTLVRLAFGPPAVRGGAAAAIAPGASEKPANPPPASQQSGEIAPPVSESFAQQAKIEIKPIEAPILSPAPETPMPAPPSIEMPPAAAQAPPSITLAAPEPLPQAKAADNGASVSARRDSDGLRLIFFFATATPAALFRRADTAWLVFDSVEPLDIEPIRSQGGSIISDVSLLPLEKGQAIRIRLNRPQMSSLEGDDRTAGAKCAVTFSDTLQMPTQPLVAIRNITESVFANVAVPLSRPGLLHRLVHPDAGDALIVATALPPVRGFIKRQDFVESSPLESSPAV